MNSVKTKQMKYTAEAKLIMPVNKCKTIEKFTDDSWCQNKLENNSNNDLKSFCAIPFNQSHCNNICNPSSTTAPTTSPYYNPADTNHVCMNATVQQCFDVNYQNNMCPNTCNNILNSQQLSNGLSQDLPSCKNYTPSECRQYNMSNDCPNLCNQ